MARSLGDKQNKYQQEYENWLIEENKKEPLLHLAAMLKLLAARAEGDLIARSLFFNGLALARLFELWCFAIHHEDEEKPDCWGSLLQSKKCSIRKDCVHSLSCFTMAKDFEYLLNRGLIVEVSPGKFTTKEKA